MLPLQVFHLPLRCPPLSPQVTIPSIPTMANLIILTFHQATHSNTPVPPSPPPPRHPKPGQEKSSRFPTQLLTVYRHPLLGTIPSKLLFAQSPSSLRIQIQTLAAPKSPVPSARPPSGHSKSLRSPPSNPHSRRILPSTWILLPPFPSKEQGPAQVPASGWHQRPVHAQTPILPLFPVTILPT